MQGSSLHSNVVICDFSGQPGVKPIAQYDMLGYALSQIVEHPTSGSFNMTAYQSGSSSVMRWSRLAHNGDASDAQISLKGSTFVVWALGLRNDYSGFPLPSMGSTTVSFAVGASPSQTPTPSPSPGAGTVYEHSLTLRSDLVVSWNVAAGTLYQFKAVLSRVAW